MTSQTTDECDKVMSLSAEVRCGFVKNTSDCNAEESYINYIHVAFCLLPANLTPLTVTLCVIWLLCLFVILGLTASKFFCPNLSAISTSLRLTHTVAGVTFLALGNGAPDIFSAMAAIARPHTAGLAVGALFGAGIFVTTVVAGSVALVKPFALASRPFLRDVIFYMSAVFWTFVILYRGTISLGEILGYLSLYVVYVLTVIISTIIYNRQKRSLNSTVQTAPVQEYQSSDTSEDEEIPSLSPRFIPHEYETEYRPLLPYSESTSQILLCSLNPIDSGKWRRKPLRWKAFKILKMPLEFLLLLCIPVVDPDKDDKNWKRPLNCLHLIIAPLICLFTFQSGAYGNFMIQGQFPLWVLFLLLGLFLCAIVFCTTTNDHPPSYHYLFAILGFVASALVISAAASEVVSLLHMLGVILSLSNTVLGLTLLAWGNSIGGYYIFAFLFIYLSATVQPTRKRRISVLSIFGEYIVIFASLITDCFSDITLAKQGYPRMAISACFGGIIFNMVFGVGLGCLAQRFETQAEVQIEPEGDLVWVLAASLGLSLVLSFIIVPLKNFHVGKHYGIFLLIFYFTFLTVALLTEFNIIKFH